MINNQIVLAGLLLGLASLLISVLGTILMKRMAEEWAIIDVPNQRSSHDHPTPRAGGIGFVLAYLILIPCYLIFSEQSHSFNWVIYLSGLGISLLGFLDDWFSLSNWIRMLVWVVIMVGVTGSGFVFSNLRIPLIGEIQFQWLSPLITFLWVIGITNFFNFMDGINGLAALQALCISIFLGWIAFQVGNEFVLLSAVIIFGGVLGFLPFNFPDAKIFMGDIGSNFLGFVFASLAVLGNQSTTENIPIQIPAVLLLLFLLDPLITLIKHIPKGKNILEPHRDHYYQRLTDLGYSHYKVSLLYTGLNLILGILALLYYRVDGWAALLVLLSSLIPFLFLVFLTEKLERGNDIIRQ